MRRKQIISMGLAAIMAMGLMAGCGSNNTEDKSSAAKETPEKGKKISLLLTYPKEKEVLYQCIEEFTKKTGIEVEIQYMPLEDSRKQINVMVASDSLPDVMDVDNTDTATYAKMGILADITDKVKSDIDVDQYYQGTLEQNKVGDKFYGLPFTANDLCLYYNMDLLTAAGVTEVPASWDAMLDACEKLKAAGNTGFGVAGSQTTDTSFQMWPFIWGAGSSWDKLGSDKTAEMLKFYKTMSDNGYMSSEVINYNAGDNANQFTSGKTAMIIDGPWRLKSVKTDAAFEWGVAKVPEGPDGFKTVLGGHNFAVVKNDNVEASWEFIKYMNQPEVMQKYSEAENYIPSRKDVANSSHYFKTEPINKFVEMMDFAQPMPKDNYNKISDIIIQMWQSVVLGKASPEDAAKTAGESVSALE